MTSLALHMIVLVSKQLVRPWPDQPDWFRRALQDPPHV